MAVERSKPREENADQNDESANDIENALLLEQHPIVQARKLKKTPDTDPSFFDQTGGILMIFVFAILVGLVCFVLRQLYNRINWSKLMGNSNGNKQRIENSSDCPISLDSRLKNTVNNLDDGSARSEKNSYFGQKDSTM